MAPLLQPKQEVRLLTSGERCHVVSLISRGGSQGEVYLAETDHGPLALKYYYPASATKDQHAALRQLIRRSSPSNRFLWPIDIAEIHDTPGFGYVMPLRVPTFASFLAIATGEVVPSYRVLARAAIDLSHSFLQLHNRGLCYRDISLKNEFFDPVSGRIEIGDCDNITVNHAELGSAMVLGTDEFMAPELVRRDRLPSTTSDLFSLAVLLFWILVLHHPLKGRSYTGIPLTPTPDDHARIFGTAPVFLFDPADDSNRPDPIEQPDADRLWSVLPLFLRKRFIQAFTVGLLPDGRVSGSVWRRELVRFHDSIVYCPSCTAETFAVLDPGLPPTTERIRCWNCNSLVPLPYHLNLSGRSIVLLSHDARLYAHHFWRNARFDFDTPTAEVVRNPRNPSQWGLMNLTTGAWLRTTADQETTRVEPGEAAVLSDHVTLDFGEVVGDVLRCP